MKNPTCLSLVLAFTGSSALSVSTPLNCRVNSPGEAGVIGSIVLKIARITRVSKAGTATLINNFATNFLTALEFQRSSH